MRALGSDVTGRHACGNAAGKGNNESHQESGLILRWWTRMTQKWKRQLYITVKAPCRFESCSPHKLHIEKQTQLWYIKQQE
jgi:hypothetical protein